MLTIFNYFRCLFPKRLKGRQLLDLATSKTKCLTKYDLLESHNRQIVIILIASFFVAIGVSLILLMLYRRRLLECGQFRGAAYHSRAFYKRADSFESLS